MTTAVAELKAALEGDDAEAIGAKTNALEQVAMKLGEIAYRKAQEKAAAEGAGASSAGEGGGSDAAPDAGDVIDADFTEGEDKK